MEIRRTVQFDEWFRSLRDRDAKTKINVRLFRLQDGNAGDTAPIGSGISELRIHVGPGYRIYYVRHRDNWIVLCGGDKSTQASDIKRAFALASAL